jgi:hypothetical protein
MFEEYSKDVGYFCSRVTEKCWFGGCCTFGERGSKYLRIKKCIFARNSWFRIGSAMMTKCLETAKDFGNAIFRNNAFYARCAKLYKKVGFENINVPWEAPVIHPVRYGC